MWNHIRRWVAETISPLAINAFVFYLEVDLETLKKEQKLEEKASEKSSIQVRAGPVEKTETRQGWEDSKTLPYYGMMAPSSLASNEMNLHPEFTLLCAKWTMDENALRWRPERRVASFHSRVVFLSFSSLSCLCPFYRSNPNLKWSFFPETFFL